MFMIAGLLAWLGAGSPAGTTAAPVRFEEPPVEFVLELDGQETDAAEGQARPVTVKGRTVQASFAVKPTRLLRTSDFSFRFPREFEFAHDGDSGSWKLHQMSDAILMSTIGAEEAGTAVDVVMKQFTDEWGGQPKPAEIRLAGRTFKGKRLQVAKDKVTMDVEMYVVRAGQASYSLIVIQASLGGQPTNPRTAEARRMLVETWAFASSKEPVDKAPFEFAVTLDGSSFDLLERQPQALNAGGATWKARMKQGDMRTLKAADVSLRYPFFYEFKGEVAEDGTDVWSMDGGDQLVMLVRLRNGDEAVKAVKSNIDIMAKDMGKPTTRPVETTFAQAKRKGTQAEFKKDDRTVVADFFPFAAGGSGYLLILSQASEGGVVPPIDRVARQSIEKSVTILR